MRVFFLTCLSLFVLATSGRANQLELFIDADYSVSFAAAEAIELGVRTALAEVNHELGGLPVKVVKKDHRGNVKRSYRNMKQFLQSDSALAMIGGLHSPPYITHLDFMNENRILTLLPWSAGAPITRSKVDHENWLFRVSVDDSKSGEFFVREAMDRQNCTSVALVLLDTGWGRYGEISLSAALKTRNAAPAVVKFFPVALGNAAAGTMAVEVEESGADCAIMMANAGNGAMAVNALHSRMPNLRIFSHWGIMGGEFTQKVPYQTLEAMDLRVLQTCALQIEAAGSSVLDAALRAAAPQVNSLAEIGAITGFVHGYDLTRLLIEAVKQASDTNDWNGSIEGRRLAVKKALENLETPVDGILKRYDRPFRVQSPQDRDAHEALGLNDLCMARFRSDGFLQDAG